MSDVNESNNTKVCESYNGLNCISFRSAALNRCIKIMGNMTKSDIKGFKTNLREAATDIDMRNTYESLKTFISDTNNTLDIEKLKSKITEITEKYKTTFEKIKYKTTFEKIKTNGEDNLYKILTDIASIDHKNKSTRSPHTPQKLKNYFNCVVSVIFMCIFSENDSENNFETIVSNVNDKLDNAITETKFNEITSIENIKKNSLPDARQVMCIQRFSHDINGTSDKCTYLFHGVGTGKTITSTSIALNYLIKNKNEKEYSYDIKANIIKTSGQISSEVPVAVPVSQTLVVVDGQPADNTTSDNVKDIEFKILIVAPQGIFRSAFIKDFNNMGIVTLNTVVFDISDDLDTQYDIKVETVDGFYKLQPEYYTKQIYPGEPDPQDANKFYKIKFIGCDYTNFFKKNSRKILLKQYDTINVVIFDEAHRLLNNSFKESENKIVQVHHKEPKIMSTGIEAKKSDAFCAMEDFELYDFCSKITDKVIYLTGTPFQKTPMDIVTIINHINFLNHKNTDNWNKFYKRIGDANAWEPLKCPYEGSGPIHDIKCAAFSMYRMVFNWSNQRIHDKLLSILKLIIDGVSIYAQMTVGGPGFFIARQLMSIATAYANEKGYSGGQGPHQTQGYPGQTRGYYQAQTVQLDPSDIIAEVKKNIHNKDGIPEEQKRLIFGRPVLNTEPSNKDSDDDTSGLSQEESDLQRAIAMSIEASETPEQKKERIERIRNARLAAMSKKNEDSKVKNKTSEKTTSGDEIDSLVKELIMFLEEPYFDSFMRLFKKNVVFKLLTYNIDPQVVKTNIHIINMTEQIIYGKLLKESIMDQIFANTSNPRFANTSNPRQNGGGSFGEVLIKNAYDTIAAIVKKIANSCTTAGFVKTICDNKSNMIKYIVTIALGTVISNNSIPNIKINVGMMIELLKYIVSGATYIFEHGMSALYTIGNMQLPFIVSGIIQILSSTFTEIINQFNEYDYTSFLEYSIDYVSIYNYDFNKYAIDKNKFYELSENIYTNDSQKKSNYKDFFTNTEGNKNNFPIKHIQYIFMPYSSEALIKFVETNAPSEPIKETDEQIQARILRQIVEKEKERGTAPASLADTIELNVGDQLMSDINLKPVDLNNTLNCGCNVKKNCGLSEVDFEQLRIKMSNEYQPQVDSSCERCIEKFMNYTRGIVKIEGEDKSTEIAGINTTNMSEDNIEYVIYNNKKVLNKFAEGKNKSLFYDVMTKDYNRFEHILILLKIMKLGLVINNINQFEYHSHYCIKEKNGEKSLHYFLPVFYPTTIDIMYSFIQFLDTQKCKYIWLNQENTSEQIDNNYKIGSEKTFPIHTLSERSQNYQDIVNKIDTSQPICVILSPSHTEGFSFTKNPAIILPALCEKAGDAEQVYGRVLRKYKDHQIMTNRYIKQIYQYYGSNNEIETSNLNYWNTLYGFGENNPNLIFKEALMFEEINVNKIDENITPTVSGTTEGIANFAKYQATLQIANLKKVLVDKENGIIKSSINETFNEYKKQKLDEILKPILEKNPGAKNPGAKIDDVMVSMLQKNYPEDYKNVFVNIANLLLYTLTDMDQLNEIYKINLVAAKYFVQMAAPENNSFKEKKIIPMDRAMLLNHTNYLQLTEKDIEPKQELTEEQKRQYELEKLMLMGAAYGGKRTRRRKPALTRRKKSTRAPRRKITRAKKHKNKHTKKYA
jgi:hypothetical protein